MMRGGMSGILCAVVLFSSSSLCLAGKAVIDEPFSFELYASNVFPWITGKKRGVVGAEKNSMGRGVEKFLLAARSDISFALYGVSKQPWFLQAIKTLRVRGVRVNAVVDQKRGAVGDWIPENFAYPGTIKLPRYVGFENISIDLRASGRYPRSSIMHHKYIVSDNDRLWFGTANMSHTGVGAEYNANVALVISSERVAEFFIAEFRQMFIHRRFSRSKVRMPGDRKILFK